MMYETFPHEMDCIHCHDQKCKCGPSPARWVCMHMDMHSEVSPILTTSLHVVHPIFIIKALVMSHDAINSVTGMGKIPLSYLGYVKN